MPLPTIKMCVNILKNRHSALCSWYFKISRKKYYIVYYFDIIRIQNTVISNGLFEIYKIIADLTHRSP